MNPVPRSLPVSALSDLSVESRIIATPWSRMLRGIGLGQYPIDHDPTLAGYVRETFDHLVATVSPSDGYTRFSRDLADVALRVVEQPGRDRSWVDGALVALMDSARSVQNPYYRVMAGCVLVDAVAKLGLTMPSGTDSTDVAAELLGMLAEISPDRILDENQGLHGDYEKASACCGVFLAVGQLGLRDRLVTTERNYVVEALDLLERIPSPYFRGRVGGMLMSVIGLLGYTEHIVDGERDYLDELLRYLARADEIGTWPTLPLPMPVAWLKAYPLLTTLNAIAICGRAEYLTRPFDILAEAKELMGEIPWNTRVHMAQYYVIALHNLGRLDEEIPDLDAFMRDVVAALDLVDPGENYAPRGNAYPYIIELAMMTGHLDLVPDEALCRMADSFPDLSAPADRVNRAFPVSYVLNVLGEIGAAELVLAPRERYEGRSAMAWVVDDLSEGGLEEGDRLSMIDNALVSLALRMRGAAAAETELFRSFVFPDLSGARVEVSSVSGG
ncbi:hypothetical protein [Cellulomonas sp. URHB0016]